MCTINYHSFKHVAGRLTFWTFFCVWSAGALSPVNHKGFYQGCEQTSIYLLVIPSPSHSITSLFFSKTTTQIISTISECKPRKTITHVLEPIYIPQVLNTGTCISFSFFYHWEQAVSMPVKAQACKSMCVCACVGEFVHACVSVSACLCALMHASIPSEHLFAYLHVSRQRKPFTG